jgi:hypothetical protein
MAAISFHAGPGLFVTYSDAGVVVCYQLGAAVFFEETVTGGEEEPAIAPLAMHHYMMMGA